MACKSSIFSGSGSMAQRVRLSVRLALAGVLAACLSGGALAGPFDFDGSADYATDAFGFYYAMTGGKFPTGDTPNGDNASGGTFRFINDEPAWGYPVNSWQKDDWFPENASLAMTFQFEGSTVYDNNGIENGTYGNFYDATAQGVDSADAPGLYRGYSMTNVWDWIYAGYFLIEERLSIDTLIGYFDENSGFDRNDPRIGYVMNIWSNVENDLLPTNTGSFVGDIFHLNSRDNPAALTTSDTGVDRVFGADFGSATDDIFRLTASLDTPLTLEPGVYWFSHSAFVDIPEPGTLGLLGFGLAALGLGGLATARRRRAAA